MKDKTYQAIVDALDVLARGKPAKTNGKITGVNLAKEAGVSKATLYRYLDQNADLQEAYDKLRKNGVREDTIVPETVEHANRLLKNEVKQLRSELVEIRRQAELSNKLKAHQIQLLWLENERLKKEFARLLERQGGNVIPLVADVSRK